MLRLGGLYGKAMVGIVMMETKSMEKTYMCIYIYIFIFIICIDGAKQAKQATHIFDCIYGLGLLKFSG